MVITPHCEAKGVLQDVTGYEQTQESVALHQYMEQSTKSLQEGRSKPAKRAFADLRKRIRHSRGEEALPHLDY